MVSVFGITVLAALRGGDGMAAFFTSAFGAGFRLADFMTALLTGLDFAGDLDFTDAVDFAEALDFVDFVDFRAGAFFLAFFPATPVAILAAFLLEAFLLEAFLLAALTPPLVLRAAAFFFRAAGAFALARGEVAALSFFVRFLAMMVAAGKGFRRASQRFALLAYSPVGLG